MRTPEEVQNELLREEIKKCHGNLSRVARNLGLPYSLVLQKVAPRPSVLMSPTFGPEPTDIRTAAKPGFEQWVIAVKRVGCGWPDKYNDVIQDARRKFDQGTHEMFQSNTRGWVVQYLVPRKGATAPRRFFKDLPLNV